MRMTAVCRPGSVTHVRVRGDLMLPNPAYWRGGVGVMTGWVNYA
jgi:hypothetical protein